MVICWRKINDKDKLFSETLQHSSQKQGKKARVLRLKSKNTKPMGVIFTFNIRTEKDGHTHAWRVYLRPFENEDLSVFVKKVQFKLHK